MLDEETSGLISDDKIHKESDWITKIKLGFRNTRLDVMIFEIVNFFFSVYFFYIAPFVVINLSLVTNGIS